MRPGLIQATLDANKVRFVDSMEAEELCDLGEPGTWIPYFKDGEPIMEQGKPFGRLRLNTPRKGKKYHQWAGSSQHVYFPAQYFRKDSLMVIEGEFKAMALGQEGISAVGINGFWGFRCEEFDALAAEAQSIVFIGDTDTTTNPDFFKAAIDMRKRTGIPVFLKRLPYGGPKGFDDWLGADAAKARDWATNGAMSFEVEPDAALPDIARECLRVQGSSMQGALATDRGFRAVAKLCYNLRRCVGFDALLQTLNDDFNLKRARVLKGVAEFETQAEDERLEAQNEALAEAFKNSWADGEGRYWVKMGDRFRTFDRTAWNGWIMSKVAPFIKPGALKIFASSVEVDKHADYAGIVCGRPAGYHEENGVQFIVSRGPAIISGVKRKGSRVEAYFRRLLGEGVDPHFESQWITFLGWLKQSRRALEDYKNFYAGQTMVLTGPVQCGKSFGQTMITNLLGGREMDPISWLNGSTPFNLGLWEAEHLVLSDAQLHSIAGVRKRMAGLLKQITVNPSLVMSGKYLKEITLRPIWRVSITANMDPSCLEVVPQPDSDNEDKIIMLKTYKAWDFDGTQMRDVMAGEYSAFAYTVDNFKIPEDFREPRMLVKHFHHPIVKTMVLDSTMTGVIGDILSGMLEDCGKIEGTSHVLLRHLQTESDTLFTRMTPQVLGSTLARLQQDPRWEGRIHRRQTSGKIFRWEITKDPKSLTNQK